MKNKKLMESSTVDPLTFYAQFNQDAALNLDGFKVDAFGMVKSSRESYDGVHPLAVRHAELGDMMIKRMHMLLDGAPVASDPSPTLVPDVSDVAARHPEAPEPQPDHEPSKEKESAREKLDPPMQILHAVGGLLKRALSDSDRCGGRLLEHCGLPPASHIDQYSSLEPEVLSFWPETPELELYDEQTKEL